MKIFLYKLIMLGILYQLYVLDIQAVKSNSQSANIISGKEAKLGQFPWHVLFKRNRYDQVLGGGSIISNNFVLTAAHILHNLTSVLLHFGIVSRQHRGVYMNSSKFFIYPTFDYKNSTDDIALVELPERLNFTNNIQAIELVSSAQASNDFVGAEGIITGFGQTTNIANRYSMRLLWASVTIINNTVCAERYRVPSIEDTVMCSVGYNDTNTSPCDGDSGGALVWKNDLDKLVQIGIISFSVANHCSIFPSGYTRVSSYLDYIHNITGLNFN